MLFDPDNKIMKLCAEGMNMEAAGKPEEASILFIRAWNESLTDNEKFTAAHYVARHQKCVADKLKWDEVSLQFALKIKDDSIKRALPSLYLNIAKCYEDLDYICKAEDNYKLALLYADFLTYNGYGNMIRNSILNALNRCSRSKSK